MNRNKIILLVVGVLLIGILLAFVIIPTLFQSGGGLGSVFGPSSGLSPPEMPT
jgi:hypothetical protein